VDEKGYDDSGAPIVQVDRRYFRPAEVDSLLGDASKARHKLGWQPRISFAQLVSEMIREDLRLAGHEQLVARHERAPGDGTM